MMWQEVSIILGLILLNGFFAMSELAIVSARRARLQLMADSGSRGAAIALRLMRQPGKFLSTVQIGITLIGIFAGAYGGATLAMPLSTGMQAYGIDIEVADTAAFGIVVAVITFLSLVVGEIVPKQFALAHAESVARWVSYPMRLLAKALSPIVWLLERSSHLLLRLLGVHRINPQTVTDEEIKALIAEAAASGAVQPEEQQMLSRVMRFAEMPIQGVMTPRPEMIWVDQETDGATLLTVLRENDYSQFPVFQDNPDNLQGVVHTRDILAQLLAGQPLDLQPLLREPLVVFESISAFSVLEQLRAQTEPVAVVVDEYGSVQGMVTSTDILAAIAGDLADHRSDQEEPAAVRRADGSWLMDGSLSIVDVQTYLQPFTLPSTRDYYTLAGFVLFHLQHMPTTGTTFELNQLRFEIVDMDGHRIDKVLITPLASLADSSSENQSNQEAI